MYTRKLESRSSVIVLCSGNARSSQHTTTVFYLKLKLFQKSYQFLNYARKYSRKERYALVVVVAFFCFVLLFCFCFVLFCFFLFIYLKLIQGTMRTLLILVNEIQSHTGLVLSCYYLNSCVSSNLTHDTNERPFSLRRSCNWWKDTTKQRQCLLSYSFLCATVNANQSK